MSGTYQKVALRPQPKTSQLNGEQRYWRHFKAPVTAKHYNKITDIEFSPLAPYDFAVTSSTRVQVYDSTTMSVKKSLSRFPDVCYSGSYRSDGKLLVAGCEDSKLRVLDLTSRVVLRTLVGHTAPVKACTFLSESRFLLSGGDDHSVRTWDVTTEQNLDVLRGHSDYVRQVREHTDFSAFCFLSAAYDHTVRYWDRRLSNRAGNACVMVLDHGAPLEDLLVLPNHGRGDLLATAGGNEVQIWSLRMATSNPSSAARARTHRTSNHQKSVLSLAYDYATDRMISGGLDHMIKIYDMRPSLTGGATAQFGEEGSSAQPAAAAAGSTLQSTFATEFMQVTHSMKFQAPILSAAISPDSRVLAVGMSDGTLCVRSRDKQAGTAALPPKNLRESLKEEVSYSTPIPTKRSEPRGGTRAFFNRGASFDPALAGGEEDDEDAADPDFRVARVRKQRLAPYDNMIKSFRYHAALDAALATNRAPVIVSLIDELINRNALPIALANRDASRLLPLLHFLARFLAHPSYSSTLVEVVHLVLDLYTSSLLGTEPEVDAVLYRLRKGLDEEIENQKNCVAIQAFMDNLSSRAEMRAEESDEEEAEAAAIHAASKASASSDVAMRSGDALDDEDQFAQDDDDDDEEEEEAGSGDEDEDEDEPMASGADASESEEESPEPPAKPAGSKRKAAPQPQSDEEEEEDEDEEEEHNGTTANGRAQPAAATSSDSDEDAEEEEEEAAPVPPPKKGGKKAAAAAPVAAKSKAAAAPAANGKAKKRKV